MSGASHTGPDTAERAHGGRSWARDLAGAIALVEGAVCERVFVAVDGLQLPERNAFGEEVTVERGADAADLVRRAASAAGDGMRVAVVARASDLTAARSELAAVAERRLGVVVHAVAEPARDAKAPSTTGLAPALALDDLFWGMLLGAGVAEAIDLALIARRAAEDSGCPFFVVHEASHAHDIEPVASPSRELCEAFLGPSSGRSRRAAAGAPAGDRAFAERVPFALGSAMRELEALTGRRHDVLERAPAVDAPIALVGAGALGDSLVADVERLRAGGDDVAVVRVVAWRPFPAPRLVRALSRAHAITVLERVDQPLASNAPLAVQLKAAFSDALTWAPDYPGIGRIPRILSGLVAPGREVDSSDLDAIVHNVMADERGKRTFVLGGDEAQGLWTPPVTRNAADAFVMRGICRSREIAVAAAELSAAVLASALGLRTRVTVRELGADDGGGVAFDLVAGRDRPRGAHAPHAAGVVAIADPSWASRLEQGQPLGRLASGGVVAVPSSQRAAEALWSEVPLRAKATVFDLGARLVGWTLPQTAAEEPWLLAASIVGVALALAVVVPAHGASSGEGRAALVGAVVEREVAEALRVSVATHAPGAAIVAGLGGQAARSAFESLVEVPRALIEREDDGVRLGRR